MESKPELVIFVHTGDRNNSGTNNKVQLILHSDEGLSSKPITLNKFFSNDLEKDKIDTYHVDPDNVDNMDGLVKIKRLEVLKHSFLGIISDDWFVDKIVVENTSTHLSFVFPFFRWIKSGQHYNIMHLDTSLPQHEPFKVQRKKELDMKKKTYKIHQNFPGGPAQVKSLPPDEQFSFSYKWDLALTKVQMTTFTMIEAILSKDYETIEDIKEKFESDLFDRPKNMDSWYLDENFGRQRIGGVNPSMIRVLQNLPEKFPVTDELLGDLLEGLTIGEAIQQKRLFIADYHLMEGMPVKAGFVICKPIGLFYVDDRKRFVPVAIQLYQQPGEDNPIFTPNDNNMTWNYVKMWYNNADAVYHQSLVHLSYNHLMMEGFCLATHRNISPSHPVFKLLSPHFLYLLGINTMAMKTLLGTGGWVDQSMNGGVKGFKYLVTKGFDDWRMNINGTLPEDMKSRGFDDPDILPGYYYHEDGMLLYEAIMNYVSAYIELYYTTEDELKEDTEIQAWAHELVKERNKDKGGCGFKGIPGDGSLASLDDLAKILTCVIFTCSVGHAAVNFPGYDEYAFTPNYPATMRGTPPTSKNVIITEKDMINSLPDKELTLDIMVMTQILSLRGTNCLGDFEIQTIFDPRALQLVSKFRETLEEISQKIKERNALVTQPYDYLDPDRIPNAISI